ncbi:MAG: peptide/nickel transport system ATP-binding protein [Bacteroidota bacterium]|nr:peptide/nickel transport system ATP-binding protein [Bacteroidota bacterium]
MSKLLEVKNLKTCFYTDDGTANAVDGVSFNLNEGETLGIVGESGCGKSVTALSILRLLPENSAKIECGEILFAGKDIVHLNERDMRRIRGKEISMIFQEPMTSLNPAYTCGNQLTEAITTHTNISHGEAKEKAVNMLRKAGISNPEKKYNEYPHRLSGGLRQRVMIAIALSCNPKILIADEPTTALDVTVQAQILDLIKKLQAETKMGLILITHDLGVIAEMADNVAVMYASKVVEFGSAAEIYYNPKHPYTIALLESIPRLMTKKGRLPSIEGTVPSSLNYPEGCRFAARCNNAYDKCSSEEPPEVRISEGHLSCCWRNQYEEL